MVAIEYVRRLLGLNEYTKTTLYPRDAATMKAISIRQPWAWLIVAGHKVIENRTWPTTYRGPIWIHAGKRMSDDLLFAQELCKKLRITLPDTYEMGGIIGTVQISDCVTASKSVWFEGPYGFVLTEPHFVPFFPVKGKLGIFTPQSMPSES